jgi:hypothetical protein
MPPLTKKKRADRFGDDDLVDEDGDVRPFVVRDGDIKVFKFLARRRFATCEEIAAVTARDPRWTRDRLRHARGKSFRYVKVCDLQTTKHRSHRWNKSFYELAGPGYTLLEEHDIYVPRRQPVKSNFSHEIMTCQILTSFDLAAVENPNIRIEDWAERLAHPKTPERTRQMPAPAKIPLGYYLGNVERQHIRADGLPFGLERTIDGKKSYFWFPGIEADMATEQIESWDFKRSSWYGKFHDYLHVLKNNIHFTHFGFNKMFIPIYAPTQARKRSIMEGLRTLLPEGSPYFLFQTFKPFDQAMQQPEPSGAVVTQPYERVGYPPLNLTT